jgi:hypothetical protein
MHFFSFGSWHFNAKWKKIFSFRLFLIYQINFSMGKIIRLHFLLFFYSSSTLLLLFFLFMKMETNICYMFIHWSEEHFIPLTGVSTDNILMKYFLICFDPKENTLTLSKSLFVSQKIFHGTENLSNSQIQCGFFAFSFIWLQYKVC